MGKRLDLEGFDAKELHSATKHIKTLVAKEGYSYVILVDECVDECAVESLDKALSGLMIPAVVVYVPDVRNVKCFELKRPSKR